MQPLELLGSITVFLLGGLMVVVAYTDPFTDWLTIGSASAVQRAQGIGTFAWMIVHIVFSSLLVLFYPILVLPMFREQKALLKFSFWGYVICSYPAILTSFVLGFNIPDVTMSSGLFFANCAWLITELYYVFYTVLRFDPVKADTWALRMGVYTLMFRVGNLALKLILKDSPHAGPYIPWMVMYGFQIPLDWVLLPWFLRTFPRKEDDTSINS